MIGKLKGTVSEVQGTVVLLETASGVFYSLYCMPDLISTHHIGDTIEMYTYLQVREDALTLFGFSSKESHDLFQMLLSVDGVGPKLGFAIISFAQPNNITSAVMEQNVGFFNEIPGVGKKTAQKILLELSSKMNQDYTIKHHIMSVDEKTIVDALVALGFDKTESNTILAKLDNSYSLEDKIKQAIQLLTHHS